MKKMYVVLVFMLLSQVVFGGLAFVGVDGVETTFDQATGNLSMSGSDMAIIVSDGGLTPQVTVAGSFSFSASKSFLSPSPDTAVFTSGTFVFEDAGATVLLEGTVGSLLITPVVGLVAPDGLLVLNGHSVVLTGGTLLPDFEIPDNADLVGLTFHVPDFQGFGESFTGTAKVNVIPEPATMALLGLGGLILRRRKRV